MKVALDPYYDSLRVTQVNGAGVDLIGFKNGVADYIEVKNWRQRYKTGPSLTPNKFRAEVRTRFPLQIKHRKILVTSATWSTDTGILMRKEGVYPYQYIHQITNPQTFKEAVAEIRYQHELRLWREEEERRLFNISSLQQDAQQCVDVVDAYYYESNVDDDNHSLNEGDNLHYSAQTSLDFSTDSQLLHRRRKNEMEVYHQIAFREWWNQIEVYNQIRNRENQK